jgi:UDP-N-acetylmuramate--alanine ligase
LIVKKIDFGGRPFHFIGIGGIGMSALAYVLARRHLPVSGSDVKVSHITERLRSLGVNIFNQQTASNLARVQFLPEPTQEPLTVLTIPTPCLAPRLGKPQATLLAKEADSLLPQVICSTAIGVSNAEYCEAVEQGCPIFHRSDLLAALIDDYTSIAVAGTHGKTTTSSLIGYLLVQAALDPTIIVGGEVDAWEGNARVGKGPYLVAEADESDGSLVKHKPFIGIVTNIELDHPDHYQNLEEVVQIFKAFAAHCQVLVASVDCETVRSQLQPTLTYSLNPSNGADYTAATIVQTPLGNVVEVLEKGQKLGLMTVTMPGLHNVSNALAAVAVGRYLGLDFAVIADAIATFGGAKRRFECRGEYNEVTFIDDYAHHPREIEATLEAARQKVRQAGAGRVIALFQPHRYSRTAAFLSEFAIAFGNADQVILTDIYSAGEINLHNLTGEILAQAIARHHPHVIYQPDLTQLPQQLSSQLQPQDLVLFLGAGNLNQTIPSVIAAYQESLKK